MSQTIVDAALALDTAARQAQSMPQFEAGHFDLPTAYAIQRASIQHRVARGEQVKGIKLGFTSRAKMVQMGVDSLIWGFLTDAMLEEDGGVIHLGRYIHPRVEPEVCFVTRRTIDAPLTALEAADYLEAVAPRWRSSIRAIAISASVLKTWWPITVRRPVLSWARGRAISRAWRIWACACSSTGATCRSARQGRSWVTAAHGGAGFALLHAAQLSLPAGSLIMAGAATAAEALRPGLHVSCHIGSGANALGSVSFTTRAGLPD